MEEFVAYIVKNLVADPEAVQISSVEDKAKESIKVEIRVAPQDIGKIIGRRGNTIHALRTILRRVCARLRKKVQVDLVQPENGENIVYSDAYYDSKPEFSNQDEEVIQEDIVEEVIQEDEVIEEEFLASSCKCCCGSHSQC
ncbi:KH domain-containing protein [Chlamydia pecorum]|uniref:KH domain-containing protein n=1 Tax=Chlamydia pecorum TaxID=85991 RepID=UPI00388FC159